jgi:hypothetical protein
MAKGFFTYVLAVVGAWMGGGGESAQERKKVATETQRSKAREEMGMRR